MNLSVQVEIDAPKEKVWRLISNIENAGDVIDGISKVEVLEKPTDGLVGLKWRETRVMFGKEATEVMWITGVVENESYETRAESHGAVYETKTEVKEDGNGSVLSMSFRGTPQTLGAKLMWVLTGPMFKGSTRKALLEDLSCIKKAAES